VVIAEAIAKLPEYAAKPIEQNDSS